MRIKHFAGYGCVYARKVYKRTKDDIAQVHIRVEGNHECGIYREDWYDIHRWLCSKFAKDCKDYRDIQDIQINQNFNKTKENYYTDVCDYIITYIIK